MVSNYYQDPQHPLVWDLDDLRLASSALEAQIGNNNFIIRGSQFSEFIGQITLLTILQSSQASSGGAGGSGGTSNPLQNILDLMNTNFQLAEPSIENAGRYYVAGYPCVQVQDILYSDQADPNDPPLKPPPAGVVRKDLVYLDVWREPVTYVDDPDIREIALGGPDTTTRLRVRYRVRVAQGANNQPGTMPADNGIGNGTLATQGSYTGQANRLYLIEIDTPGEIGTATFRWSEDNASTIQRVIAPIPPGTTRILVEMRRRFIPATAFSSARNSATKSTRLPPCSATRSRWQRLREPSWPPFLRRPWFRISTPSPSPTGPRFSAGTMSGFGSRPIRRTSPPL